MARKRSRPMETFLELPEETQAALCDRIANFTGNAVTLESALGALIIGQHYGTRALRMVHSPSTYRKYEKILGLEFENVCKDEYTHLSTRLTGLAIAKKLGAYWDVVMGRQKVPQKGWMKDRAEESP